MKKTILTALAALLVAVPAVKAQKVNKEALLAKIEKSDTDIANEKKAAKAATWLARGKAFYEVAVEPTKSIFANMEPTMLKLAVGEPKSTTRRRSTARSTTHGCIPISRLTSRTTRS